MIDDNKNLITIRTEHNTNYKTIGLFCVQDNTLSWKAKGIHNYFITRPDDWTILANDLKLRSTDGNSSLYSGIDELLKARYLFRIEKRNDKKQIEKGGYLVVEQPASIEYIKSILNNSGWNLKSENLNSENLKLASTLYNNKYINNKKISSKEDISVSDETQTTSIIKRRNASTLRQADIQYNKPYNKEETFTPTQQSLKIYSYWEGKGLHVYKEENKGYLKDLKTIKQLMNGKIFNNTEYMQYKNHKFTNKEIYLAIGRFALFALNNDYEPRNKWKYPSLSLEKFIYNSYSNMNNGFGRSLFIYCLENNIKLVKEKDIIVEDKYPIVTKAIKKKYAQTIMGMDDFAFTNQDENDFRKAAIFAQEFLQKNKSRLIGSYQELKPYKVAECLLSALMKTSPAIVKVKPYWLYNSVMQKQLPAYLYSTAIMKEESGSSSNENNFYNFGQPLE